MFTNSELEAVNGRVSFPLSVESAMRELARPLVFGDERQIAAVDFLVLVESCVEAFHGCRHDASTECRQCGGTGEVSCSCFECGHSHRRDCYECDGTGEAFGSGGGCRDCLRPFTSAIVAVSRRVFRKGWPVVSGYRRAA